MSSRNLRRSSSVDDMSEDASLRVPPGRLTSDRSSLRRVQTMIQARSHSRRIPSGASGWQELSALQDDAEFLQNALPLLEDAEMSGGSKNDPDTRMIQMKKYSRTTSTRLYLSPAHDWLCWDRNDLMSKVLQKGGMGFITISHIVRVEVSMNTMDTQTQRTRTQDTCTQDT